MALIATWFFMRVEIPFLARMAFFILADYSFALRLFLCSPNKVRATRKNVENYLSKADTKNKFSRKEFPVSLPKMEEKT